MPVTLNMPKISWQRHRLAELTASLNHTGLVLDPLTTTLTLAATPSDPIAVGWSVRSGGGIAPRTVVTGYSHPHVTISNPITASLVAVGLVIFFMVGFYVWGDRKSVV